MDVQHAAKYGWLWHGSWPGCQTGVDHLKLQTVESVWGGLAAAMSPKPEMEPAFRDLPTRVRHTLYRAGYWTVSQVAAASDQELLRLRGLGMGSLARIRAWANDAG